MIYFNLLRCLSLFFLLKLSMKVLLVTIVIGDKEYWNTYNRLFRISQENYAKKHGYDFKIVENFLDGTHKENKISLYFQKSLVCNQSWSDQYDYIVYIDNDVYINIEAPAIHEAYDFQDKIGMVDEWSQPSPGTRSHIHRYWNLCDKCPCDYYYNTLGIDYNSHLIYNSGVMVFQPKKHKTLMNEYYNHYMPMAIHSKLLWFEQASIGYFLIKREKILDMGSKFNALWNWTRTICELDPNKQEDLVGYFKEHYFIHFAGRASYEKIPTLHAHNNIEYSTIECSLGMLCHTAQILKKHNKKHCSYPFDWIFTTPKMVTSCLRDNFACFLDKSQYVDPPYVCPYGTEEKCGHKTYHEELFNHRDPRKQHNYDYYVRCVNRFRDLLASHRPKKFYIMTKDNYEDDAHIDAFKKDVIELTEELAKHTKDFQVIAIYHKAKQNEYFYECWNIIPNLNLAIVNTRSPTLGVRFKNPEDDSYFESIMLENI